MLNDEDIFSYPRKQKTDDEDQSESQAQLNKKIYADVFKVNDREIMTSGQEKSFKALKTTIDGKLVDLDNFIDKIEIKDLNCSSENFI